MSYPDPDTTSPETRARWHIETAIDLQRMSEDDEIGSPDEQWHLASAANHVAIASALIALEALADQQIATIDAQSAASQR